MRSVAGALRSVLGGSHAVEAPASALARVGFTVMRTPPAALVARLPRVFERPLALDDGRFPLTAGVSTSRLAAPPPLELSLVPGEGAVHDRSVPPRPPNERTVAPVDLGVKSRSCDGDGDAPAAAAACRVSNAEVAALGSLSRGGADGDVATRGVGICAAADAGRAAAGAGLADAERPVPRELDERPAPAAAERGRPRPAAEGARFTIRLMLRRASREAGGGLIGLNGETERLQHLNGDEERGLSPSGEMNRVGEGVENEMRRPSGSTGRAESREGSRPTFVGVGVISSGRASGAPSPNVGLITGDPSRPRFPRGPSLVLGVP